MTWRMHAIVSNREDPMFWEMVVSLYRKTNNTNTSQDKILIIDCRKHKMVGEGHTKPKIASTPKEPR